MKNTISLSDANSINVDDVSQIENVGLVSQLTIFQDGTYFYLALMGGFLGGFGVFHDLQVNPDKKNISRTAAMAEIGKGVLLGIAAIPFWYIFLMTVGNVLVDYALRLNSGYDPNKPFIMPNDIWMLLTVPLTFRVVPIVDSGFIGIRRLFLLLPIRGERLITNKNKDQKREKS